MELAVPGKAKAFVRTADPKASWFLLVPALGTPSRLYAKLADNQLPYGFPIGLAALIMIPQIFSP